MVSHAPANYHCPICLGVKGIENQHTFLKQTDVVYKKSQVTAFINSFFIKNNPGHVIVVPNQHFENLYDLPADIGHEILNAAKLIAQVMKRTYRCEGITLLQNNEPVGGQQAFHFHLHILPRYPNDELHSNMTQKQLLDPKKRAQFAQTLKTALSSQRE